MTPTESPHFSSLQEALSSLFGRDADIARSAPVSGGDINNARRLELTDGRSLFMKSNSKDNLSFFVREAAGLQAIAQTGTIGTPLLLCTGTEDSQGGYAFLLMEYIPSARRTADYWETFARQLALLHSAPTQSLTPGGRFGFPQDNYIGAREQKNTVHQTWVSFFRDCRLEPQFRSAAHYFDRSGRQQIARLLDRLEDLLVEPAHPSLLHGDLWSGNVMAGSDGKAWLIDPAAYVGHAEADIAMTELFGGFPPAFYDTYRKAAPLQPGYSRRRDLYNLYQLLNHLNMFGSPYLASVNRILKEYDSLRDGD